jgi:hypothetical protein
MNEDGQDCGCEPIQKKWIVKSKIHLLFTVG